MAYIVPTFNLAVRWRRWIGPPYPPGGPAGPYFTAKGQLRPYRFSFVFYAGQGQPAAALLLPAHTDVRASGAATNGDLIEVPSGSGLWWQVQAVADVAKGFANEYRMAGIFALNGIANAWTYPQP